MPPDQRSTHRLPRFDLERIRRDIIAAFYLRREVDRLESVRRDKPDLWRWMEEQRVSHNRELASLHERLQRAGCRVVTLEPSPGQKMKKTETSRGAIARSH